VKKSLIITIAVIAVLIIAGGIGFYVANQYSAPPASNPETGQPSTTPPETGTSTKNVEIKSFAFNPSEITISVGDTITWTNMDSMTHTITSDSGNELSGSTNSGGTYSHKFDTAGTFSYHCSIHTSMKGKVIVQ